MTVSAWLLFITFELSPSALKARRDHTVSSSYSRRDRIIILVFDTIIRGRWRLVHELEIHLPNTCSIMGIEDGQSIDR